MSKQMLNFTAHSTTWSGYTKVAGCDMGQNQSRTVRVFCTTTNSTTGATATLSMILRHKRLNTIIAKFDATVTQTTTRTGADGSSGDYVCTVSFDATSNDKLDLLGGMRPAADDYEWAIGFSADGATALLASQTTTLYIDTDSEI